MSQQQQQSQVDADGFHLFQVAGLEAPSTSISTITPTGTREEVLLVSWIILLLQSCEDGQVRFEWAYSGAEKSSLSTPQVMPGLQSTIGQVSAAVAQHIAAATQDQSPVTPTTLLLSTGTLSQAPEEVKDTGVTHVEVGFESGNLKIRPVWHSPSVLEFTVGLHVTKLADLVQRCLSNPESSIEECLRATTSDLDEIWRWNHELPPTYSFCTHEMVTEWAQKAPESEAIASWDGNLTYAQVDRYSTHVAWKLKELGLQLDDILPICFEKSRWTIVAVLAAMKAGATFALMDPTLPLARLQNMAQQVGGKMMLSSRKQHDLATSILPGGPVLVVEEDTFQGFDLNQELQALPTVPPTTLMYIIFTSGSTGTPKGVTISHQTYTSSAIPRAKAVGYTPESRVLDFASYAFDVSIDSMLLTLSNGGCLCIPSDEDRLNDINGAFRRMRINYAGLTPSVARILDADVISSLTGLGLGGEAVSARDVKLWGQDTRIIIGYGPCECTIGCTVNSSAATGRDYISIGPGNGAAMWITDPNDHDTLMPVGAVGELLVEGPIVGQGYLNDPEKTATVFIEDPKWLVAGHNGYEGRRGRLYKTGDLGRYDPDGSGGIVFVGRKDTQVKLRGQRVELGEIESQLKDRLPSDANVIAEVVVPQGTGGQATLVAFVTFQSAKANEQGDLSLVELSDEQQKTLSEANADVAKVLPRYMVPTVYIPVNYIPVLISSKTDRKRLRQFATTVDIRQLDQGAETNGAGRELTDLEQRLRQAWSVVLKQDAEGIRAEDNFFALGGDSVMAMRLVSVCREQGLDLTVANTFGHPTLSGMAGVVQICATEARAELPPFSMISQDVESACREAAAACGVDPAAVEDIYPCTPTQESLFTFSLKSVKLYVAQRVARIPSHIDLDAWKKAWEEAVAAKPILRTRLVQLQDPGLQQVVLKENITWKHAIDLAQYLENDREERMNLGESLARYAIVDDAKEGKHMVWTIHHVVYDGWSEPLVLKDVSDALSAKQIEPQAQMRDFVKYVHDTDAAAMNEFWRRELQGAVGPQFPRLPSRDFMPTPDAFIEHMIPLKPAAKWPFTMATLIRGAWALVASQYSGSDDVVFGETLTGRDIALPGVESIIGPLIATLPVRIHVSRTSTVESYLQAVQQTILARVPYQHMGMQNIRKVSHDAQHACEAGTGLVVQLEPEYLGSDLGFETGDVVREALHFNPYPLMLGCAVRKGGFRICASFDGSLIEVAQMKRMLVQLEVACVELTKGLQRRIEEISCLPEVELNQIWQWNQTPPLTRDESSGRLRADATIKQGAQYPSAVVPWVVNARNPALLSPIGCVGELWLEGAFVSGENVQNPAWLVAGSSTSPGRSGTVQSTGDMVQLREDGSLVFVGRKENVVSIQGHAVDIADIEMHLNRQLPAAVRAAAAIRQSLNETGPELVVLVERPSSDEESLSILPASQVISGESAATLSATVPVSAAIALKKLDKFIRDSLPSYMSPSAYIVVDKLPTQGEQSDHSVLNQLASKIPQDILEQTRNGIREVWAKTAIHTNLTAPEKILRSAWAKILRLPEEEIDVDDNFFRLGGDSVLAMKLVSSLRSQGHNLSVADIFQHMRLGDAARVLRVDQASKAKQAQPYQPFSTLGRSDVEQFLSQIIRPQLAESSWSIKDVLPVTDSQALDIRATVHAPRTSIQYTMLIFDQGAIDRERLLRACSDLVKTHDILRTVFVEHESAFYQVVLNELATPLTQHTADKEDLQQYITELCNNHIASDFPLGSSFLQFFHVEALDGREALVLGLSHAQYDGESLPHLLRDLETLYTSSQATDQVPFSAYMAHITKPETQTPALTYWKNLLHDSTLAVLPSTSPKSPASRSTFHTQSLDLDLTSVQETTATTTATLLTASWALALARLLQTRDVTFGGVTTGRTLDLIGVENVVGPCYQLAPIRINIQREWTAVDLLGAVQRQSAESAAYDFVGFGKIARECAPAWQGAGSFDSIVHHQDFEDFDTMPFAGRECAVDILNPHGDAAYPVKVVSFVKGGQLQLGVVGSEEEEVKRWLDLVAETVREVVSGVEGGKVLLESFE
ncbi:nonribosomal peptide synthase SidD [Aspergillus brunneoviolaceus CBS 621.78]|uniref:Acetyl-CoA synthetase-like protein n=1 Tax=Aspergillus brunneoviolaceus CBS 621.78 TaxID=1450534 RepID=A0ACD1GBY2_9EURO|nr:acetyl-CoA synthetase-like protein [Aspergillus brunneoviolaceus CBS 621.78]RAH46727.1 acetyl-CoA synthetase-like protein [Aspergillus brunneoviolaceus CBS 621.78]